MKKLIEKIRDHYEEKAIIKFIKNNMSKIKVLHQEIKDMKEMDYQDQKRVSQHKTFQHTERDTIDEDAEASRTPEYPVGGLVEPYEIVRDAN